MSAKYAFIESEEGNHPIIRMCEWSGVSRSGYYDWRGRVQSATAARREILAAEIKHAFDHSDGTYGYRRIHAQLARWGTSVDPETVRSIVHQRAPTTGRRPKSLTPSLSRATEANVLDADRGPSQSTTRRSIGARRECETGRFGDTLRHFRDREIIVPPQDGSLPLDPGRCSTYRLLMCGTYSFGHADSRWPTGTAAAQAWVSGLS